MNRCLASMSVLCFFINHILFRCIDTKYLRISMPLEHIPLIDNTLLVFIWEE